MSEATIDKLQIEVESDAKNASQGLEKLKKTLEKIKKVSENSGLSKVKQELKDISSINLDNVKPLATMLDNINSKSRKALNETKKLREELEKMKKTASVPATDTPDISLPSVSGDTSSSLLTDTTANSNASSDISKSVGLAQRLKNILGSIRTKTANTDVDKLNAKLKTSNRYSMSLGQLFKQVVLFGGTFRLFSMATTGVSEGLQNIARYSNETSTNMDKLSTMSLHLKNSIGAALYPVLVALTPAFQAATNVIVGCLNAFNMFISALSGKSSYIKAISYLDSYVDKTETATAKIKRSLAGFDEINIIGDNSSKSAGTSTPDYSSMFKNDPITAELKDKLSVLSGIVGASMLAVGAILAFSGTHPALGIGLMAAGAVTLVGSVSLKWNELSDEVKNTISIITTAVSAALLAVGACLAFSGTHTALGIGLMAAGAVGLVTSVAANWNSTSDKVQSVVDTILACVGGALLVLGAILAFSGVSIPIGLGLMAAGGVALGAALVPNWESITDSVKNAWTNCKQWLSDKKTEVKEKWQEFTSGIKDKTAELKGKFTQKKKDITEKWNSIVSGVKDKTKEVKAKFSQKKKDITEKWNSITSGVKNKTKELKGKFTQKKKDLTEKWADITEGIKNKSASVSLLLANGKTAVTNLWESVKTWWGEKTLSFKLAISDIQSGIKGFINTKLITPVNNVLQKIDKDWKIPLLYKDGGIVPYGQMFIAREAGPEMVGTIGNQTAVANNSQIVEGIASGVYEANSEQNMLLREEISLLRQILNKDSSFEITAASVARSFYRKNMRDGRTTVPVGV